MTDRIDSASRFENYLLFPKIVTDAQCFGLEDELIG